MSSQTTCSLLGGSGLTGILAPVCPSYKHLFGLWWGHIPRLVSAAPHHYFLNWWHHLRLPGCLYGCCSSWLSQFICFLTHCCPSPHNAFNNPALRPLTPPPPGTQPLTCSPHCCSAHINTPLTLPPPHCFSTHWNYLCVTCRLHEPLCYIVRNSLDATTKTEHIQYTFIWS